MSLLSAWQTVAVDHQLPHRVDLAVQRTCRAAGFPERLITRAGLRFRVRRLTCDEDFVTNVVERREYLQHGLTIQPRDTVVDIGANIGTFTVLAGSLGARVFAVEPDTDNMRLLVANVSLNGIRNVTIDTAAAAGQDGTVELQHATAGGGYHTTITGRPIAIDRASRVRAVTLASLFALRRIDHCAFLKLDCEGAEFDVLDALTPAVAERIDQIAMEYHCSESQGGQARVDAMRRHLTALGFRVVHHEPFPAHPGGHLYLRR